MSPLEIGLSFLEGVALIASPCILPVLPLVLSSSVEGGKKRPFGIILGFVLSFTIFAMLSRKLVGALHLDLDYIKYGSLILLGLFGLILLSETLSTRFSALTQRFANAGTELTAGAQEGFGSGVLIGLLIGLVWTPCAGPILAAVLVQIIRQESDVQALLLVSAFAFGAGAPMLAIAMVGRKLLARASFLTRHSEGVRKAFGVIILLAVAFIASGIDPQRIFQRQEASNPVTPSASTTSGGLKDALAEPYPAPEFAGIEGWLNGGPVTMQSLKGKVVLVDFWTYSCINCVRTLPAITGWDRKYRDQGLVVIGVHSPEFEFEKKRANVEAALVQHGIGYSVALDNRLDTWSAFKNRYWPAHYLIDRDGRVVYTHFGEGNYAETENNIRFLLGLDQSVRDQPAALRAQTLTPETYLGHHRADRYHSEPVALNDTANYHILGTLPLNGWGLEGRWRVENERIVSQAKSASLTLNFNAKKVFLVLGTSSGGPVKVSLTLNGQPVVSVAGGDAAKGSLTVKNHTLYELVNQDAMTNGILRITAEQPGLEAYAFTFGG